MSDCARSVRAHAWRRTRVIYGSRLLYAERTTDEQMLSFPRQLAFASPSPLSVAIHEGLADDARLFDADVDAARLLILLSRSRILIPPPPPPAMAVMPDAIRSCVFSLWLPIFQWQ